MDGVININKPSGMTSSDVVVRLRRILKTKKIGHTGTLDPEVTGVLPLCVRKATRLAEYLTDQGKSYRAEITLGITTDTQDGFGKTIGDQKPSLGQEDFEKLLPQFLGTIKQVPPMYSAVRHQGKHLYELARQGIEVERVAREVQITRMELLAWYPEDYPRATFDVDCSKGTYIRTLCSDLGEALGCGAHMSGLVRRRSGPFHIADSLSLEEIEYKALEGDLSFLIPMDRVLDLPRVCLDQERAQAFCHGLSTSGNRITIDYPVKVGDNLQVFFQEKLLGIGVWMDNALVPHKVLERGV